jgi:lysylphosphatidylglycerol synthetase-like protein (DUF2156 family)
MSIQENQKLTPLGVQILTVLAGFAGMLMVIGGMTLMAIAPGALPAFTGLVPPEHIAKVPIVLALIGSISVTLGIAFAALAIGLYKRKHLAWGATMIVAFIGIGIGIFMVALTPEAGLGLLSLILSGATLYYMHRPHVKEYFRRKN